MPRPLITVLVMALLVCGSSVSPAAAQDEPCVPQVAAVEAATAKLEGLDTAFATIIAQVQALAGPLSAEAPELLPVYATMMSELEQISVPALTNTGDTPGVADRWVNESSSAELAQLNAGLLGPNGKPRQSVALLSTLIIQARAPAEAVAAANQDLATAVQQLSDCAQAAAAGG